MNQFPVQIATKRLLDSVWTLEFRQLNNYEIEIVSYRRDNTQGYEDEKKVDKCSLIEGEGRIVQYVEFSRYDAFKFNFYKVCKVVNPKYIFNYDTV